ncbi:uncharacterized protein [Procambarus clarkii]|uniref:uncharacterized protein n=1 Tax=Procambarus clarkii TaxID=6728 RepID=UPI0037445F68
MLSSTPSLLLLLLPCLSLVSSLHPHSPEAYGERSKAVEIEDNPEARHQDLHLAGARDQGLRRARCPEGQIPVSELGGICLPIHGNGGPSKNPNNTDSTVGSSGGPSKSPSNIDSTVGSSGGPSKNEDSTKPTVGSTAKPSQCGKKRRCAPGFVYNTEVCLCLPI